MALSVLIVHFLTPLLLPLPPPSFFFFSPDAQSSFSQNRRVLAREGAVAVCPRKNSSGSRLCPPGDVSDHPKRVRGWVGAHRQLQHLRWTRARRLRGGEAAPCSPGLPTPPRVGRAQATPGRTTVPSTPPKPRRPDGAALLTAFLRSGHAAAAPCNAGPGQRAFGGRGGAAATGHPDTVGASAPSMLSSCLLRNTSCAMGLCEVLADPSQPRYLFHLGRN